MFVCLGKVNFILQVGQVGLDISNRTVKDKINMGRETCSKRGMSSLVTHLASIFQLRLKENDIAFWQKTLQASVFLDVPHLKTTNVEKIDLMHNDVKQCI